MVDSTDSFPSHEKFMEPFNQAQATNNSYRSVNDSNKHSVLIDENHFDNNEWSKDDVVHETEI